MNDKAKAIIANAAAAVIAPAAIVGCIIAFGFAATIIAGFALAGGAFLSYLDAKDDEERAEKIRKAQEEFERAHPHVSRLLKK